MRIRVEWVASGAPLVLWIYGALTMSVAHQTHLPTPTIRDSAGIRIVEYPSLGPVPPPASRAPVNPLLFQLRQLPEAFRVDLRPYLDLGGLHSDERQEFDASHSMLGVVELRNGTLVVNDRTQLKFFTSTGAFIRAVGRKGKGPGEFQQTRELCVLRGDTVLALDFDGRLSLWTSSGSHIQTLARPGDVPERGCFADGSVVVQEAAVTTDRFGNSAARHRIVRPNGTVVRELGLLPAPAYFGALYRGRSIIPYGRGLLVGGGRTFEISVRTLAGQLERITRFTGPLIRITEADWQERIRHMFPKSGPPERHKRLISAVLAVKPPDTYPAYSRVLVDPVKRTWIQDCESELGWTVVDSSGLLLGRYGIASAPSASRVNLVSVARDHLVRLEDDGEGAVHLRFYRFAEASGSR